jgi:hypothetical protein
VKSRCFNWIDYLSQHSNLWTHACHGKAQKDYSKKENRTWLRWLSRINPLTYQVDALRGLMIEAGHSGFGLGLDLLVQGLILAILVAIAAKLYPKIVT